MLLTNDHALAERAASLRSFAANISDHVRHQAAGTVFEQYVELGYNYRMTDMQAAMGIEQLRKLDGFIAERRAQAARYDQAFAGLRGIVVPSDPAYTRHTYQSYWIRLRPESGCQRDEMPHAMFAMDLRDRLVPLPRRLEDVRLHYPEQGDVLHGIERARSLADRAGHRVLLPFRFSKVWLILKLIRYGF